MGLMLEAEVGIEPTNDGFANHDFVRISNTAKKVAS